MRAPSVGCWVRCAAILALVTMASGAQAGRPLVVEDAEPVETDRVQIGIGAELTSEPGKTTGAVPLDVSVGLAPWLETGMSLSGLYVERNEASPRRAGGVGDLILAAKAKMPFRPLDLDLAVAPSVKIPTADRQRGLGTGQVDAALTLIGTTSLSEHEKLHGNIGYSFVGRARGQRLHDVLFVGVAGEARVPGLPPTRVHAVAELFGSTRAETGGHNDVEARVGLVYFSSDDLVLDAAVGRSLTTPTQVEFFATFGVTWTFDAPWKPRSKQ